MSQWTVIIKNYSGLDQMIDDLGFPVPDSTAEINIDEQFTYDEISGSDDLRALVDSGDLVINDGTSDLSTSEGVKYLTLINKEYLENNYYDKTYLDNQLINKNTLDEAYNEGGDGAGRVIDATSGAVKIDVGEATNAPLELTEKSTLPSTDLAAGQLTTKDGTLFVYDGARSKWISTSRLPFLFGRKGKTTDQYLNICGGSIPSNLTGIPIPKNAVIVAIMGEFESSGTGTFEIRKNDETTPILSLTLTSQTKNKNITANIDINADDTLQGYFSSDEKCDSPTVFLEIAWR